MVVSGRQVRASRGLSCFACLCSGEETQAEEASHEALLQERLKEAEEKVAHLSTMIAGPPRFEVKDRRPSTFCTSRQTVFSARWQRKGQSVRFSEVFWHALVRRMEYLGSNASCMRSR